MTNSEIQKQFPGLWVAVKEGSVVAARQTPHALVLELAERGITGATIKRAPADCEPELVGLG
jgi:PII-like signaling protein